MTSGGPEFDAVQGFIQSTNSAISNNQNQAASVVAGGYRNPSWVCRWPDADVTYPEFYNAKSDVWGTTDPQSAGTAHTHTLNITDDTFTYPPMWGTAQDTSFGGYITISQSRVMTHVGVIVVDFTSSGSPSGFVLDIFKENLDLSLTLIATQDITASVPTGTEDYRDFALSPPLVVQAGERYAVRVRNSSTNVNASVGMKGIRITPGMVNTSFVTLTATETNRTSYTTAQAALAQSASNMISIWACLASKGLQVTPKSYNDNFDRVLLGSQWITKTTNASYPLVISGGKVVVGIPFGAVTSAGLFVDAVTTDADHCECYVSGTGLAGLTSGGPIMHANSDFSQMVYLGVAGTTVRIFSGAFNAMTQRATLATTGNNDGLWGLDYDPTTGAFGTYTVTLNGIAVPGISWAPTTGQVSHGRDYRLGGMQIVKDALSPTGYIDTWMSRDRAA